jgi:hypothetical protein
MTRNAIMNTLKISILFCILQIFFPLCSQGQETRVHYDEKTGRYTLQQDFFRIKYYVVGEHAVPAADTNKNGIPDFVEDLARQLRVAHHVFCEISGFHSPLASAHYPGLAYVDVCVYNRSKMNNVNGRAFDAAQSAKDPGNPAARSVVIHIAADIDVKKNLTPAHEYFHQIQNGISRFKNSWYYEGMARWSEDSLGIRKMEAPNKTDLAAVMEDSAGQDTLFAMTYKAAQKLWIPLGNLCSNASIVLPDNDPILDQTYSDGTPVMQDRIFTGARMMREILAGFAAVEDAPFSLYQYGAWSGAARRDPRNNPYMVEVIRKSAANVCPQSNLQHALPELSH